MRMMQNDEYGCLVYMQYELFIHFCSMPSGIEFQGLLALLHRGDLI